VFFGDSVDGFKSKSLTRIASIKKCIFRKCSLRRHWPLKPWPSNVIGVIWIWQWVTVVSFIHNHKCLCIVQIP